MQLHTEFSPFGAVEICNDCKHFTFLKSTGQFQQVFHNSVQEK